MNPVLNCKRVLDPVMLLNLFSWIHAPTRGGMLIPVRLNRKIKIRQKEINRELSTSQPEPAIETLLRLNSHRWEQVSQNREHAILKLATK